MYEEIGRFSQGMSSMMSSMMMTEQTTPQNKALYREFADKCLPPLRFCLHNMNVRTTEDELQRELDGMFVVVASSAMKDIAIDSKTTLAALGSVMSWPPVPPPVAAKPFLFDVAYVANDLKERMELEQTQGTPTKAPASPSTAAQQQKKEEEKKKGWLFGWL